jgi:phage tail-like protein
MMAALSGPLNEIGVRADPVLSYNFLISLLDTSSTLSIIKTAALSAVMDVALGGFSECSGLEMTLDIEEYEEGGRNGGTLKFPTRVKWQNITLKKGVGAGTALWDWHYSFAEGRGKRRDGIIVLQNDLHIPNNIWYFRRGLPVRYTGPTLNASQSAVAIESIEIAHEELWQVPYVSYGTATVSGAIGMGLKFGR